MKKYCCWVITYHQVSSQLHSGSNVHFMHFVIGHCNIPKLVSYTEWWYGIFQYHTTIWIVVWYWKIPYHHLPSDFEKTNFWYITMRIPWLCLGGICKYWPHSSKLGSNVNLPPAAVGLHWAPISQNIGQYLLIPPRQSQGIVTL